MVNSPDPGTSPEAVPSDELVALIQLAAETADGEHVVPDALRRRFEETGDREDALAYAAFNYHLKRRYREARSQRGAFAEYNTDDYAHSPPIATLPEDVLAFWESLTDRVTSPVALSRLHHLLFEAKHGDTGAHIRLAAGAYAEVGSGTWEPIQRVNLLHWSVTLYRRMGRTEEIAALRPVLVALVDGELDGEKTAPGAVFHALEALLYEGGGSEDLPRLLEHVKDVYGTDPWHFGTISALEDELYKLDPERRQRGQRERTEAWIRYAEGLPVGINRAVHLEDAMKMADRHGFPDLLERATLARQQISFDQLGMVPMGGVIRVQESTIEAKVEAFLGRGTFAATLQALAEAAPPSGTKQLNEAAADEADQNVTLVNSIPTRHARSDGMELITAATEEELADERLARYEVVNMNIGSEVVARVLERAIEGFNPSIEEVDATFSPLPHVSQSVRDSIRAGLALFSGGIHVAAASVVMPRVETLARDLAEAKNVLRYNPPRPGPGGSSIRGQYPQLGSLLRALEPWQDPSWARFLSTFLISPFGLAYRNKLLHGDVEHVSRNDAALTLLAAIRLALVPLADGEASGEPDELDTEE